MHGRILLLLITVVRVMEIYHVAYLLFGTVFTYIFLPPDILSIFFFLVTINDCVCACLGAQ